MDLFFTQTRYGMKQEFQVRYRRSLDYRGRSISWIHWSTIFRSQPRSVIARYTRIPGITTACSRGRLEIAGYRSKPSGYLIARIARFPRFLSLLHLLLDGENTARLVVRSTGEIWRGKSTEGWAEGNEWSERDLGGF